MKPIKKINRMTLFAGPDWRALLLEAESLSKEGRHDHAKKLIQRVMTHAPKKCKPLRAAYAIHHQCGDLNQATEFALQLAKRHSKKADHYILLSRNLVSTGRSEEALHWLSKGLRRFPDNPTLLNMRSELQMIKEEAITFAMPRRIHLPSKPLVDFANNHQLHSLENESTETLIQKSLNELDLEDPGEALLYHCHNAIITRSYGVHNLAGHPYFGTVLTRQKFSKDGKRWAKYPLGYPFKIPTPRTEDINIVPIAFYITNTLCDHFGHLLTEAVSSINPLLLWKSMGITTKNIPIIIPANQDNQQGLRFNAMLRSLGLIDADFLIPGKGGKSLLVRDLFVARPSIILGAGASKAHPMITKEFLRRRLQYEEKSECNALLSPKIFISRSKLANNPRAIPGIHELESALEKSGWLIFHPQLYSIQQQINIYESAKYICSTPGSALHLLYGLELKKLRNLVLLAYESERCHNLINYIEQLKTQALPHTILNCLTHEDTNSGIGEYFSHQKSSEIRLEMRSDLSPQELALQIDKICK